MGRSRASSCVERLAVRPVKRGARRAAAACAAAAKAVGRAREHELARGEVVVRAGVDPEQLRVALDLGARRGVDAVGVREDRLEHVAHLEVVRVSLVVEDVAPGERRLVQMPDERLLPERQRAETVGVELHDRRLVDLLEEVTAIGLPVLRRGAPTAAGGLNDDGHDENRPLEHGGNALVYLPG